MLDEWIFENQGKFSENGQIYPKKLKKNSGFVSLK